MRAGRLRTAWRAAHTPVADVPRWAAITAFAIPSAVLPSSLRRIGVAFLDDDAAGKRGDLPLHQRASGDQRSEPGQAGAGHGLARQLEPATAVDGRRHQLLAGHGQRDGGGGADLRDDGDVGRRRDPAQPAHHGTVRNGATRGRGVRPVTTRTASATAMVTVATTNDHSPVTKRIVERPAQRCVGRALDRKCRAGTESQRDPAHLRPRGGLAPTTGELAADHHHDPGQQHRGAQQHARSTAAARRRAARRRRARGRRTSAR